MANAARGIEPTLLQDGSNNCSSMMAWRADTDADQASRCATVCA